MLNQCVIPFLYKTASNMAMHVLCLIKVVWIHDIEANQREEYEIKKLNISNASASQK